MTTCFIGASSENSGILATCRIMLASESSGLITACFIILTAGNNCFFSTCFITPSTELPLYHQLNSIFLKEFFTKIRVSNRFVGVVITIFFKQAHSLKD